jgi:hypothetical protein
MAFKEKKDWFGLAKEGTNLVAVGENDGATSQVVDVHDDKGSFILSTAYGETIAPSVDYKLKGTFKQVGDNVADIALGQVAPIDGNAVALVSLEISTGTGAEPTVAASGEQVQDGATTVCKYIIPPFELKPRHHAQILFDAFTVAGNGCHLQTANYSIACSVSKATKDGVCLAFDVIEGVIEASITIAQVGEEKPVLTPGDGWTVSGVLACENPDAAYPTWSATLKKNLAKTEG